MALEITSMERQQVQVIQAKAGSEEKITDIRDNLFCSTLDVNINEDKSNLEVFLPNKKLVLAQIISRA